MLGVPLPTDCRHDLVCAPAYRPAGRDSAAGACRPGGHSQSQTGQHLRAQRLRVALPGQAGGWYGVAVQGNDTLMRGYDPVSGLSWAQTSTRLGRMQFFSGLTSDGNLWLGRTRQLGWNVISRFSTSQGDRARTSCNRVAGCEWR